MKTGNLTKCFYSVAQAWPAHRQAQTQSVHNGFAGSPYYGTLGARRVWSNNPSRRWEACTRISRPQAKTRVRLPPRPPLYIKKTCGAPLRYTRAAGLYFFWPIKILVNWLDSTHKSLLICKQIKLVQTLLTRFAYSNYSVYKIRSSNITDSANTVPGYNDSLSLK